MQLEQNQNTNGGKPEKNILNFLLADFNQFLQLKRYSYKTNKTYRNALNQYFQHLQQLNLQPEKVQPKDIEIYLNKCVSQNNISAAYQKIQVSTLKLPLTFCRLPKVAIISTNLYEALKFMYPQIVSQH